MITVQSLDQVRPVAMRASQSVNEQHHRAIADVQVCELVPVQHRYLCARSGHGVSSIHYQPVTFASTLYANGCWAATCRMLTRRHRRPTLTPIACLPEHPAEQEP